MTLYIYNEIFVEGCYDIQLPNMQNPIIIDVGSNTGLFVLRMKQLYPDSIVYGYEPMPSNFTQLESNLKNSQLTRFEIFRKGIGSSARMEKLYVHEKNLGGHSIYNSQTTGKDYVEIELISIEDALQPLNGKPCDLLKLDCEGAEYEIMKSITHEIAPQIKLIIFESTPSLYDIHELINHLKMIGYTVRNTKGLYHAEYNGISAR
jgi:FkbM family methyltransferase